MTTADAGAVTTGRRELAAAAVLLLIVGTLALDLPVFLFLHVDSRLLPKYLLVIAFGVASGGALALVRPLAARLGLLVAVVAYLAWNVAALSWTPRDTMAAAELTRRAMGVAALFVGVFAATLASDSSRARRLLVGVTIVGGASILLDAALGYPWSSVVGRAAGVFTNPNIAAGSMSLLILLSLDGVRRSWREAYFAFVALVVLATLSRGGYAAISFSGLVLLASGTLDRRRGLAVAAIVAFLVTAAYGFARWRFGEQVSVLADVGFRELLRLTPDESISAGERGQVARAALELIGDFPVRGAGLLATTQWRLPVSTHNIFLRAGAELGSVGLALLCTMFVQVARSGRLKVNAQGVALGGAFLILCFTSHNVLDNWSHMVILGLVGGGLVAGNSGEGTT